MYNFRRAQQDKYRDRNIKLRPYRRTDRRLRTDRVINRNGMLAVETTPVYVWTAS